MGKPRLFISTDMQMMSGVNHVAGDKDDVQSLVHALMYQDKVNIVGIASTTSKHQPGANDDSFILKVIDAYAKDASKLEKVDSAFKSAAELRDITYQGTKTIAGSSGIVAATEASRAIIAEAKEAKAAGEYLYVATWGGLGDVARALRDAPEIASTIRLLSASGPKQEPNAYKYIKDTFAGEGQLWWVDAQSTQLGIYASPAGKTEGLNNKWAVENAKSHGALGDLFYQNTIDVKGKLDDFNAVKMGDSFSVFYLIDSANNNNDPTAESWAGEYRKAGDKYWTDRTDQSLGWSGSNGAKTTYENRGAWQADFEERLDWLQGRSGDGASGAPPPTPAPAPVPNPSPAKPSPSTGKTIDGDSKANTLTGGSGNDVLDGKAGADKMSGGAGNDTYYVDNKGDVVVEPASQGTDEVHASVTFTLSSNVEELYLRSDADIDGTGNASANILFGNSGNNDLYGLAGDDRLEGRGGDDRLVGGAGDDTLAGGEGHDRFVFGKGSGDDVVLDFKAGGKEDRIEIDNYTSYKKKQVGADTLITFGDESVLLKGVAAGDLTSADFAFI